MKPDLLPAVTCLQPHQAPHAHWRWTRLASVTACILALAACATGPQSGSTSGGQDAGASSAASPSGALPGATAQPSLDASRALGQDLATKHALFKVSAFDALPGWQQDNLGEAWAAFKESCRALERKPTWAPLCAKVKAIKDPKAGRQFMEREFALLTVQNTDRTREGDITGYYEPLLQGRAQRDARFNVPVYGVPNDLYFLDWKHIPAAQRKGLSYVKVNGRLLTPAKAGEPGAISINLRNFTLDTLDRRLRVRLQGSEGVPYYSRADIARQAALDAPVLAWVDDPVALYAMQVQGAGRIRLPDGGVIRLQYADQNGHPFKPMQLAAQGNERVQTRGRANGDGSGTEASADADIEHFDLADEVGSAASDASAPPPAASEASDASDGELLTRGGRKLGSGSGGGNATAANSSADGDVAAAVSALTPQAGGAPKALAANAPRSSLAASTSGSTSPATSASPNKSAAGNAVLNSVIAATAARPGSAAGGSTSANTNANSGQVVSDLLTQAQQGSRKPGAAASGKQAKSTVAAASSMPAVPAANAATGMSTTLLAQRNRALNADPSYVFFRVAPDQSKEAGPVGALGVPLTAGRSLAVDPRVLPLGYPVFLDAAGGDKRQPHMQRLMFAQDTGGAIRGAVRADYFWGFGADAGKQARRTKQKGRMWVMVPHAEVEALMSSKLVTRGGKPGALEQRECLIDDEAFCDDDDTAVAP